jgi:hypothetical protein
MEDKKTLKNKIKIINSNLSLLNKKLRSEKLSQKELNKLYKKQQEEYTKNLRLMRTLEKELILHNKNNNDSFLIQDLKKRLQNIKDSLKKNDIAIMEHTSHEENISKLQDSILELVAEKCDLETQLYEL